MKYRLFLLILLLIFSAVACQSAGEGGSSPPPTYTPFPTYTPLAGLNTEREYTPSPELTATPSPIPPTPTSEAVAFEAHFLGFHRCSTGTYLVIEVVNKGTADLEPSLFRLNNTETGKADLTVEKPHLAARSTDCSPERKLLLSGKTGYLVIELNPLPGEGASFIAYPSFCQKDNDQCSMANSELILYREELHFSVVFVDTHLCEGDQPWSIFEVENTGRWFLEDAMIDAEKVVDGAVVGEYTSIISADAHKLPFLTTQDACQREQGKLQPGETSFLALPLQDATHGDGIHAVFELCAGEDFCAREEANFNYQAGPSFTADFSGSHPCEDSGMVASFNILNTGPANLESSRVILEDKNGEVIFEDESDEGFISAKGGCSPQLPTLGESESAYLKAGVGTTSPGEDLRALVELCTEDQLGGKCATQEVAFTYLGNLSFQAQYAGTTLCVEEPPLTAIAQEYTYAVFEIVNTGNVPFEFVFTRLEDLTHGKRVYNLGTPHNRLKRNNAPFVAEGGCYPGESTLGVGKAGTIIHNLRDPEPGTEYEIVLEVCTEDGGNGACKSQSLLFSYQE